MCIRSRPHPIVPAASAALILALAPATAAAQQSTSPASRWTVEIHAGVAGPQQARGTGVDGFPEGAPFTTAGGAPSRSIPSWYFGDGARLFNQVRQQFASEFGLTLPAISPLDATLTGASAQRGTGVVAGARITRRMSPRYSIEAGVDYARSPLEANPAARRAIEESRASFEEGFTALLATAPIAALNVTSVAEFDDSRGYHLSFTGAVVLDVLRRGPVAAHVVGGGGFVSTGGASPEVRVRGAYQFRLFDVVPYNENDSVTIRFVDRKRAAVGIVGGGVTCDLRARQAIRVDVRATLRPSGVRTIVTTTAALGRGNPREVLPSATSPSLQFSTVDGHASSLTAGRTELETFTGSGLQVGAQLTVGYLFRF